MNEIGITNIQNRMTGIAIRLKNTKSISSHLIETSVLKKLKIFNYIIFLNIYIILPIR